MNQSVPLSPSTPHFQLGPGFWRNVSPSLLQITVARNVEKARSVLIEHALPIPERSRLDLIAMAAVEATQLFFNAVLHEPSKAELDEFFGQFVLRSVRNPA